MADASFGSYAIFLLMVMKILYICVNKLARSCSEVSIGEKFFMVIQKKLGI